MTRALEEKSDISSRARVHVDAVYTATPLTVVMRLSISLHHEYGHVGAWHCLSGGVLRAYAVQGARIGVFNHLYNASVATQNINAVFAQSLDIMAKAGERLRWR